ncbi:MAG: chromate transporter, partial [Actinomyces sp.]|nr:chromate transporter [Actinomyces sp.]
DGREAAHVEAGVSRRTGLAALCVCVVLLLALPVLTALTQDKWVSLADAFYRAGALVFGGGHVVLPLLQGEPVIAASISQEQFLAGYSAAQAIPGPLFTLAAPLGFAMEPAGTAPAAAALALVAIFLPGLLLVVAALPYWELVRTHPVARSAMAGANAAVVGILLAAWWTPIITTGITGLPSLVIALGCVLLLVVWKRPAWIAVLVGALAGAVVGVSGMGLTWGQVH